MKPETKKYIGRHLYVFSAGMIGGQIFFYVTTQTYTLTPTVFAIMFITIGKVLRTD